MRGAPGRLKIADSYPAILFVYDTQDRRSFGKKTRKNKSCQYFSWILNIFEKSRMTFFLELPKISKNDDLPQIFSRAGKMCTLGFQEK